MNIKKTLLSLILIMMASALGGCTVKVNINMHTKKAVTDRELLDIAEKARIANPWGETQSLQVVSEWVGFDFAPPAEEITLDNGCVIRLKTYRYMTGTAEALYLGDDCELTFRQSTDLQGTKLAGDHNIYSSKWSEDICGLPVFCQGDGKSVNLAYYDEKENHFSITFNCSQKGKGLSPSDLARIIKSTGL